MPTDRYTKMVLTIIAIALSLIAVRVTFSETAKAEFDGCGRSPVSPCYSYRALIGSGGLPVEVRNWPR